MTIKFDIRFVTIALVVAILVMFGLWRPWEQTKSRTIDVTGQAEITAEPDEFTFNATYQKTATERKDAISAVSALGNEVVAKLKEIGVEEKKVTTNVSTGSGYYEPGMPVSDDTLRKDTSSQTAIFSLTAIVNNKTLAQKVTDYIATTPVQYAVTPQYGFSSKTRKDLEAKARTLAIADGKKKAAETATALGVELGKVQEISEVQWGGGIFALEGKAGSSDTVVSPIILPGEQEISFSILITYELR